MFANARVCGRSSSAAPLRGNQWRGFAGIRSVLVLVGAGGWECFSEFRTAVLTAFSAGRYMALAERAGLQWPVVVVGGRVLAPAGGLPCHLPWMSLGNCIGVGSGQGGGGGGGGGYRRLWWRARCCCSFLGARGSVERTRYGNWESRRSGEEQVEGMYHAVAKGSQALRSKTRKLEPFDVRLGASTTLRKTLWSAVVNLSPVVFLCLTGHYFRAKVPSQLAKL